MKKRFLAILLACAFLMTACAGNMEENASVPVTGSDNTAASQQENNTTTEPDFGTSESGGDISEVQESAPWEPIPLSDMGDVQVMSLPFEAANLSPACESQVIAVSNCVNGMCSVAIIDMENLTYISTEITIYKGNDDVDHYVNAWFLEGMPLVADITTGEVVLLDGELNELYRTTIEGRDFFAAPYPDQSCIGFRLYNDVRTTWVTVENNRLCITEEVVETDKFITQLLPLSDSERVIAYIDNTTWDYSYMLSDGKEVSPINIPDSANVFSINGCLGVNNFIDNEITIYERDSMVKKSFSYPAGAWLLSGGSSGNNLFFAWQGGGEHKIYRISPETGNITACLTLSFDEAEASYMNCVAEAAGCVLVQGYWEEKNQLALWKPESISSQDSWSAVRTENYEQLCRELAQEISENYNIRVLYGNDAVRYFEQYAVISDTNERRIYSALTSVKSVLSKFPEGFLKELTGYSSIEILLTGSILSNGISRDSINTASAFTSTNYDTRSEVVVVDIGLSCIEKDLPHEMMHVIEDSIYYVQLDDINTNYDVFSRWDMLNPEGFEYAYVYTNEDGSTIDWYDGYLGVYYYEGAGSVDDVYFVDGYSTTYPKEDRARLFENLFWCCDELPAYFSSKNIQLKANYLCVCLRECYESLRDCDDIIWERGITPEHDIEWFWDNYDYTLWAVG